MIYLGFNIKAPKNKHTLCMDVLTRLFLSYDISATQAINIYKAFESGHSDIQKIIELTDGNIQTVLNEYSKKNSLCSKFASKIQDWRRIIGEISEADFDYIYDHYGITYESIMGYPVFQSAEEMANYIRKTIKGQDEAVSKLAIPFFQHYIQLMTGYRCPISKPIMICGPTGCGKTEMLSLFSEVTGSPLIVINTSECTATGWRGTSINDVIANQARKYKQEDLSKAIIFIDEIDKITHTGCQHQSDDLCLDIQRDIMNLTDGRHPVRLNTGLDKSFRQTFMELPVDRLLIVFSGAFSGIDKIIARRLNISSGVGFSTRPDNPKEKRLRLEVTPRDLSTWGFLDELVGRIGMIVTCQPLDEKALYDILIESKKSILHSQASYTKKVYNTTLRFTDGALRLICLKAKDEGLGFRGVQTILSTCLSAVYYKMNICGKHPQTVEIDENLINKQFNYNL